MKKSAIIIAVFACFCQLFAGNPCYPGWQTDTLTHTQFQEFEINDLTIEAWDTLTACTGNFTPKLTSFGWPSDYFVLNASTNLGKQMVANLMMAKATGRKVSIRIPFAYQNLRPLIDAVAVK